MRDIYLYDDVPVLKNKKGIKSQEELNEAEADYVVFRLKELALHPMKGSYDLEHLLRMHYFLFQDLYEWAGEPRKLNIYKEEPVLGGMSIEYSDVFDIRRDTISELILLNSKNWNKISNKTVTDEFCDSLAALWKIHLFREGNTRTIVTFCSQYIEEQGYAINRKLFENHADYVRTALVAYNAVFKDADYSKKEYLHQIVHDALFGEKYISKKRIGIIKGRQIFAPGYDFDEDNEEIAKMFGEID